LQDSYITRSSVDMKNQTVLKTGGLMALLLVCVSLAMGQAGEKQHPDMSYLKSSQARTTPKVVAMSSPDGYFDNLELAKKTPEKVVRLNLQGHKLKSIPADLCAFTHLEELDLSGNDIKSLEVGFTCPSALKRLYINGNNITELPAKLAQLTRLQVLVAYDNPIAKIDPAIGAMSSLKELWLSGNGSMASFQPAVWNLKNLETLRLWNFGMTQIPDQIAGMQSLHTLCLQNNHLTNLNPKVCALPQLNYLNLGKNAVTHLPDEIRQCTRLGYLGIFENPIAALPMDFAMLSKTLERLSAWETNLPASVQSQIQASFTKTAIMFEAVNLH
jgi:Leucine-rich repeat (LRR) protein